MGTKQDSVGPGVVIDKDLVQLPFDRLPRAAQVALVRAHGPTCAAWLVNRHRRVFHKIMRALDLRIPEGKEPPTWFSIAMRCLEGRRSWTVKKHVNRLAEPPQIVYRVEWMGGVHEGDA